jgi:hypothetical protein
LKKEKDITPLPHSSQESYAELEELKEVHEGMTEDKLKTILNKELSNALGMSNGQLAEERSKALNYYKGKLVGDLAPSEIMGRSNVVDLSTMELCEWMLPSLLRMFTDNSSIIEFVAKNEEAERSAKYATEYIGNHVFFVQNDGFNVLQTAFKDALISKNSFIKTYWDSTQDYIKEEYQGIDAIGLDMLYQDPSIQINSIESVFNGDSGVEEFDVVVHRIKDIGQVRIEVIPPEDVRVHPKAKDCDTARFIAHRFEKTIAELEAEGYNIPDNICSDSKDIDVEHYTRANYFEESFNNEDDDNEALKNVVGYECYIRLDYDGDGIVELRKVVIVNNYILENIEVTSQPFVSLVAIPNPHQFFGIAPVELAMEAQKSKTQLKRMVFDNINMTINGRTWAVNNQVNLDDLLDVKPNGVVRVESANAVGVLDVARTDISGAIAIMNQIDAEKKSRTGLTDFSNGGDVNPLMSQTATGATILSNRADSRIELIGRNFANGLKKVAWKMLELISLYQDEPIMFKHSDKWAEISPREWVDQFNLSVNIGLGTNNKREVLGNLKALQDIMTAAAQVPGLVSPQNAYEAAIKTTETLGFTTPEKYFTNPEGGQDPRLLQQIDDLQNQLTSSQSDLESIKVERDAFFLQTQSKSEEVRVKMKELEIKEKELDLKNRELELKKSQVKVQLLQEQQKIELAKSKATHDMSKDEPDVSTHTIRQMEIIHDQ